MCAIERERENELEIKGKVKLDTANLLEKQWTTRILFSSVWKYAVLFRPEVYLSTLSCVNVLPLTQIQEKQRERKTNDILQSQSCEILKQTKQHSTARQNSTKELRKKTGRINQKWRRTANEQREWKRSHGRDAERVREKRAKLGANMRERMLRRARILPLKSVGRLRVTYAR